VAAFAAITVAALVASGAWNTQSHLERLFVGLSLIAWAGLGWLLGRIFGIGTGGPIARLRDAVFALAVVADSTATTAVAVAARPVPETLIARVNVQGQVAQFAGRSMPLVGYQVGFEYLQIEHALAGARTIIPLAIVGTRRIEFEQGAVSATLTRHFWNHAESYARHGLLVRKRVEQFPAFEPGIYEVVQRAGEIRVRSYRNPPT
jgi:hypothetical protein